MSRIRSLHPGIWTDEDFVCLSPLARLLFMGLWNEADDKGIFEWKPLTLKMRVLPGDNADIAALLGELTDGGRVRQFTIAGKSYGAIRNFGKFQRPKKPNDVHPVTPEILAFCAITSEPKHVEPEEMGNQFPTGGEIGAQMEEEGGRREEIEELEPEGSCASADAPTLKPEHVIEVWNDHAPRLGKPKVRDLTPERRQLLKARIAQYALDDFQAVFGKIERSAFLRGDTGWHGCTFDWVFKKANFQKIIEGNYDQ